jgi:serine/threonine protein kinase
MGVVYKAEDLKLKRDVALKFLPPGAFRLAGASERFLIEAQAAAALSHPNICVIHEVGEDEARPYIAMEYVEGETLRDRVKKGPMKAEEALNIVSQIAAGLGEAHAKGIIHRDIKSANIMVTTKGQAKVMDFGLAKLGGGSSLTRSQTTLGTVAYMSPEQARGDELDQRTDLWSLGVVLYEMLTGELPFKGDRDLSVIHSIVHEEPKPLRQRKPPIPEELQQVVAKALKKNREARYASAGDMFNDLRKYHETLQAEAAGLFNLRSLLKRLRRPAVAVPRHWPSSRSPRGLFLFQPPGQSPLGPAGRPPGDRADDRGERPFPESPPALSARGASRSHHSARPQAGGAFREVLPGHRRQDRASRRQGLHEGVRDPRRRVDLCGRDPDREAPDADRVFPLEIREGGL